MDADGSMEVDEEPSSTSDPLASPDPFVFGRESLLLAQDTSISLETALQIFCDPSLAAKEEPHSPSFASSATLHPDSPQLNCTGPEAILDILERYRTAFLVRST